MSLFQRIKTPFSELADDYPAPPRGGTHAVGALLRERREELGLDLDTIGEELRIKPVYLAALEQGRADDLPGPAYAIGFFRAYTQYLGLDTDYVLDSYKAETGEIQTRPDLSLPVPLGVRSLPGGPILLVALILALCGYGTWYYLSTGERARPERVAAVPAELRQPSPPETATSTAASPDAAAPAPPSGSAAAADAPRLGSGAPSPQAAPPTSTGAAADSVSSDIALRPTAAALPPPSIAPPASGNPTGAPPSPSPFGAASTGDAGASADRGHIEIRAVADCWIQVRSADTQAIVYSRVLKAGETYRVPRPGLLLRTGNAGALAIVVDGKPAPAIGAIGALLRNVALDPEALLAGTASRG